MLSSATPYLHLHNFHLHVSFFFFVMRKSRNLLTCALCIHIGILREEEPRKVFRTYTPYKDIPYKTYTI